MNWVLQTSALRAQVSIKTYYIKSLKSALRALVSISQMNFIERMEETMLQMTAALCYKLHN